MTLPSVIQTIILVLQPFAWSITGFILGMIAQTSNAFLNYWLKANMVNIAIFLVLAWVFNSKNYWSTDELIYFKSLPYNEFELNIMNTTRFLRVVIWVVFILNGFMLSIDVFAGIMRLHEIMIEILVVSISLYFIMYIGGLTHALELITRIPRLL